MIKPYVREKQIRMHSGSNGNSNFNPRFAQAFPVARVVLLDLDGTVVEYTASVEEVIRGLFQSRNLPVPDRLENTLQEMPKTYGPLSLMEFFAARFLAWHDSGFPDDVSRRALHPLRRELVDACFPGKHVYPPALREGVESFLKTLKNSPDNVIGTGSAITPVKCGIITSRDSEAEEFTKQQLNDLGIAGCFDYVYLTGHSDSVASAAERKAVAIAAIIQKESQMHPVRPEEVWMVGDSKYDVQAGHSAGVVTFSFEGSEGGKLLAATHPQMVIGGFHHLTQIFNAALANNTERTR